MSSARASTLVFPESTCTNGKALLQFKLGAFLAGTSGGPRPLQLCQRMAANWRAEGFEGTRVRTVAELAGGRL